MLIYKKDKQSPGKVIVTEVSFSAEDAKVSRKEVNLLDILSKSAVPYITRLGEDEVLITGNSSILGDGIFKDYVFSKYQKEAPLSVEEGNPLRLRYDTIMFREEEPKLLIKEGIYHPKYPQGGHFSKAYEALVSDIGILTEEVYGSGIYSDTGSISSCQAWMLKQTEIRMIGEEGKKTNFIVTPDIFDQLIAEFSRQKEIYIDFAELIDNPEKKITIQPMANTTNEKDSPLVNNIKIS